MHGSGSCWTDGWRPTSRACAPSERNAARRGRRCFFLPVQSVHGTAAYPSSAVGTGRAPWACATNLTPRSSSSPRRASSTACPSHSQWSAFSTGNRAARRVPWRARSGRTTARGGCQTRRRAPLAVPSWPHGPRACGQRRSRAPSAPHELAQAQPGFAKDPTKTYPPRLELGHARLHRVRRQHRRQGHHAHHKAIYKNASRRCGQDHTRATRHRAVRAPHRPRSATRVPP
jgi:hypothetical protein